MSHSHAQKEKPKKIREELKALREAKEMAEEARAEMLRHNHLLIAGNEEIKNPPLHINYIKRPEDMERLAKNIYSNDKAPMPYTEGVDRMQSNIQQLLDIQLRAMTAFTESWSQLLNGFFSARMENTSESASK